MFKKSLLIGVLCLSLIALVVTGGTAMGDTTITIVLNDQGETRVVKLDGKDLSVVKVWEGELLPPGRVIPDADLGKIYKFLEDKKNSRCVKRNCRWY